MSIIESSFSRPKVMFMPATISEALVSEGHGLLAVFDNKKLKDILSPTEIKNLISFNANVLSYLNLNNSDRPAGWSYVSNFVDLLTQYLDAIMDWVNFDAYGPLHPLEKTVAVPKLLHYDGEYLIATILECGDKDVASNVMRNNFEIITKFIDVQRIARSAFMTDVISLLNK